MKKVTILRIIMILIIGTILIAKPLNIFATDLNDLYFGTEDTNTDASNDDDYEDAGELGDIKPEGTDVETEEPETPIVEPQATTQTQTEVKEEKEELPEAGIVEDTIMIASVVSLMSVAIFAFVKMSDYSNI